MNVFVTGASGFVGGHLCRYLNECGHNIFVSKSDILHTESLLAELKSNEWDACIHLAAISSYLQCQENPSLAFQVNLAGTAHLLELIGRLGKEVHFIFASTAQVYRAKDNAAHLVFKEDSLVGPQTVYGKSKLYSEEVIRKAYEVAGGKFSILRLFNHTHKTQPRDFFVPHIYNCLIESEGDGVRIPVGNIDVSRDLGSIFDLVRAFESIISWGHRQRGGFCEVFNVCSGEPRKLRKIAEELGRRLEKEIFFEEDSGRIRSSDIGSVCGDNQKIVELVGWHPMARKDHEFLDDFLKDS